MRLSSFLITFLGMTFLTLLVVLIVVLTSRKKENFTDKDPMIVELHAVLSKIHPKANDITIKEGPKSYTVNKKDVTLCLRDPDGEYYNKNMLTYVAVHELAHTLCKSVGHTQEFYDINDKLLQRAADLGHYNFSIPVVKDYIENCGMG
jgi:hypothetical protein